MTDTPAISRKPRTVEIPIGGNENAIVAFGEHPIPGDIVVYASTGHRFKYRTKEERDAMLADPDYFSKSWPYNAYWELL